MKIEYAVPRRTVEKAVQQYLKKIAPTIGLRKAIIFGSYARDDYSYNSDIDLAIIADNLPMDLGKRYAFLKEPVAGLDLEPFGYTMEEWRKMLRNTSSFADEISRTGRVLYDSKSRRVRA